MSDDPRWHDSRERDKERERDPRDAAGDPRDAFVAHVDLPRGLDRELVRDRDREYSLRESESRTLSVIGAFRVVSSRDLQHHDGRRVDPRSGDLRHLREQGLVRMVDVPGHRHVAVVLTDRGRDLLNANRRDRDGGEGMPVKLSDELVESAREEAANTARSITGQIEHWARIGRSVEALLGHKDIQALSARRRMPR